MLPINGWIVDAAEKGEDGIPVAVPAPDQDSNDDMPF
jgi:hypothetical protein